MRKASLRIFIARLPLAAPSIVGAPTFSMSMPWSARVLAIHVAMFLPVWGPSGNSSYASCTFLCTKPLFSSSTKDRLSVTYATPHDVIMSSCQLTQAPPTARTCALIFASAASVMSSSITARTLMEVSRVGGT